MIVKHHLIQVVVVKIAFLKLNNHLFNIINKINIYKKKLLNNNKISKYIIIYIISL